MNPIEIIETKAKDTNTGDIEKKNIKWRLKTFGKSLRDKY